MNGPVHFGSGSPAIRLYAAGRGLHNRNRRGTAAVP